MVINIKNDETEQLVRQLAELTGESMTTAVEKYRRIVAIAAEMREIIGDEPLRPDDLYDPQTGLPA